MFNFFLAFSWLQPQCANELFIFWPITVSDTEFSAVPSAALPPRLHRLVRDEFVLVTFIKYILACLRNHNLKKKKKKKTLPHRELNPCFVRTVRVDFFSGNFGASFLLLNIFFFYLITSPPLYTFFFFLF